MSYPDAWQFVLLALASFRIWVLLSEDDVLDRPRRWLLRLGDWEKGPVPEGYRRGLGDFIQCPWCFGFWISLAVYVGWLIDPKWTLYICAPLAVSAALGLIERVTGD